MRTFDAIVRPGPLALIGAGPPLLLILVVQGWAMGWRGGDLAPLEMLALLGLAPALSVGALAWVLGSVAGYSVEPGRLVVHRVLGDRAYPLDGGVSCHRHGRTVKLVSGSRPLRLWPADPAAFLAAVTAACGGRSGQPRVQADLGGQQP